MNKPDAYMPFYALDFWQAVKGLPDGIVVAYLQAITYYWFHTNCKGLKDDEEFLRKVCERERDDWDAVKLVVFDNEKFFTLDAHSGLWHQKRAKFLWKEAELAYKSKVERTEKARAARWAK